MFSLDKNNQKWFIVYRIFYCMNIDYMLCWIDVWIVSYLIIWYIFKSCIVIDGFFRVTWTLFFGGTIIISNFLNANCLHHNCGLSCLDRTIQRRYAALCFKKRHVGILIIFATLSCHCHHRHLISIFLIVCTTQMLALTIRPNAQKIRWPNIYRR